MNRKPKIENVFLNYWGIWILLGALFIFLIVKIVGDKPLEGEKKEVLETVKAIHFETPDYVGSARCKDCHWREYDAWRTTLHSKFVQLPGEYTVIGDFKINNKLTVKVANKSSKRSGEEVATIMSAKGGRFYVNTIGPDGEFHDYEIIHVIGIGRRQNYITAFPNGEMHVLPVEWDLNTQTWGDYNGMKNNYPGDGEFWSDSGNNWQFRCGGCHVTGLKINYDKDKNSFDSRWADLGIGCEACHGPGSNHVKAASVYFEQEKETIVNPARLPWRLGAMVCGQCHNWGASTAEVSPYKAGFPVRYGFPSGYLPGKALYQHYIPETKEEKKHHQQYNEWQESVHAKAGVMCTTCHAVHPKDTGVQPLGTVAQTKLTQDTLCVNCHQTLQRRGVHRIHTFGSCIACHMPATKGHEHSHTFQFISPEESIRAGGVDKKPNSCSSCHHHKDTPLVNLVEFLDAAKKADMPKPFTVHGK
ncbi:MAG: ammonia-forming cytochrome c nitrite reductase subunit c552 [Thermodesulfovibrionia bacterium]|nr:ammonia-forming cytochrome c nitrite reductase subunit c552 [Thermodesulfovibrionia bacterium]